MSSWSIDPQAVQGVLDKVGAAQAEIAKDLESGDLDPVAKAVTMPNGGSNTRENGVTGAVMSALNTLFESEADNIATIQSHILAGVFGVANATYEYVQAQALMADGTNRYDKAEEMQAAMFEAANTGDLSYFDQNAAIRPSDGG